MNKALSHELTASNIVRAIPRAAIVGVGWIAGGRWGCLLGNESRDYENIRELPKALQRMGILRGTAKNFARFDRASCMTCCATGLALHDAAPAGVDPSVMEIGIIGTNAQGCLDTNVDYYRDYIESGRKMGRGNLFIYTLPTSPFSEASIHYRLRGPQYHVTTGEAGVGRAIDLAEAHVSSGDAAAMVAVHADSDQALAVIVMMDGATTRGSSHIAIEAAMSAARGSLNVSAITNHWGGIAVRP